MVTITMEMLMHGQSIFGGWSRKQVECLGIEWPLRKGWMREAVGKEVTKEAAQQFIFLTDAHIDPVDMANYLGASHMREIRREH